MHDFSLESAHEASQSYFHERLVASFVALENFLAEIRSASGREEMLALTLRHLESLLPIQMAGFYFPSESNLEFTLQTTLQPEAAHRLNQWVEQAIDTGVFGWALKNLRPAALKTPDGMSTLILAALRTRQRVLGMFAAILSTPFASAWDANAIMLTTHLACAADAILSEELTVQLQEHNRTLDSLVRQRTQQLEEAKEAAEIATQAKSRFLATMSHELRTPLNAILGYTQILRDDSSATPKLAIQFQAIQQSAEHLLSLINDLLDLSKAEAACLEIVPSRVALHGLIGETESIIRPLAQAKSLDFQCEVDADLPAILWVDAKRLRQVLINLLGNAIKFTQQGSVQLQVVRHNQQARFAITDTGCGIAAQDLPKLFQPFQQLGENVQRAAGTGLGLSICKKILQAMDVDLVVRSEPGKGTLFQFDLKLADCGDEPEFEEEIGVRPNPAPLKEEDASRQLPLEQVTILKEIASSGDILGLQQELEKLAREAVAPQPVLARLVELATACKIKAVREELEKL